MACLKIGFPNPKYKRDKRKREERREKEREMSDRLSLQALDLNDCFLGDNNKNIHDYRFNELVIFLEINFNKKELSLKRLLKFISPNTDLYRGISRLPKFSGRSGSTNLIKVEDCNEMFQTLLERSQGGEERKILQQRALRFESLLHKLFERNEKLSAQIVPQLGKDQVVQNFYNAVPKKEVNGVYFFNLNCACKILYKAEDDTCSRNVPNEVLKRFLKSSELQRQVDNFGAKVYAEYDPKRKGKNKIVSFGNTDALHALIDHVSRTNDPPQLSTKLRNSKQMVTKHTFLGTDEAVEFVLHNNKTISESTRTKLLGDGSLLRDSSSSEPLLSPSSTSSDSSSSSIDVNSNDAEEINTNGVSAQEETQISAETTHGGIQPKQGGRESNMVSDLKTLFEIPVFQEKGEVLLKSLQDLKDTEFKKTQYVTDAEIKKTQLLSDTDLKKTEIELPARIAEAKAREAEAVTPFRVAEVDAQAKIAEANAQTKIAEANAPSRVAEIELEKAKVELQARVAEAKAREAEALAKAREAEALAKKAEAEVELAKVRENKRPRATPTSQVARVTKQRTTPPPSSSSSSSSSCTEPALGLSQPMSAVGRSKAAVSYAENDEDDEYELESEEEDDDDVVEEAEVGQVQHELMELLDDVGEVKVGKVATFEIPSKEEAGTSYAEIAPFLAGDLQLSTDYPRNPTVVADVQRIGDRTNKAKAEQTIVLREVFYAFAKCCDCTYDVGYRHQQKGGFVRKTWDSLPQAVQEKKLIQVWDNADEHDKLVVANFVRACWGFMEEHEALNALNDGILGRLEGRTKSGILIDHFRKVVLGDELPSVVIKACDRLKMRHVSEAVKKEFHKPSLLAAFQLMARKAQGGAQLQKSPIAPPPPPPSLEAERYELRRTI